MSGDRFQPLRDARDLASRPATQLLPLRKDGAFDPITVPPAIVAIAATRRNLLADLTRERDSRVSAEAATVEECYRLLTLAGERLPKLLAAESSVDETSQTLTAARARTSASTRSWTPGSAPTHRI